MLTSSRFILAMKKVSKAEMLEIIRKDVEKTTLRKTAKRIGVTPAYLSDILRERRDISQTVAGLYGFERQAIKEVFFLKIA